MIHPILQNILQVSFCENLVFVSYVLFGLFCVYFVCFVYF